MIFVSSIVPLEEIPDSKEKIANYDWFLFLSDIRNKDIRHDDKLCHMYNLLYKYTYFYKSTLYNYLVSDNYYYKSNLYMTLRNTFQFICIRKIDEYENIIHRKDIAENNKQILLSNLMIKEEDMSFCENDIKQIFDSFKENNFRKNPICEYTLFGKK